MRLQDKIPAFEKLGIFLNQFSDTDKKTEPLAPWLEELNDEFFQPMDLIIETCHIHNPWFTEDNLRFAIGAIGKSLNSKEMSFWLNNYIEHIADRNAKTIAVIMAGNIPLVGFHDMLCVLVSGHKLMAKLSVKDDQLLKMIATILCSINSDYVGKIFFEEGRLKDFDAVIATGSGNTSRYFEYYFGKYPHIIRKNRNSAAILDGSETKEELKLFTDDVFRYFGLGCRSVSKLFVPLNYDFTELIEAFSGYNHLINHNNWANNYEYQKAIHLIDKVPHIDTGFLLIKEDNSLASPIAVINYEKVEHAESALEMTKTDKDKLQCIVGKKTLAKNIVPFGKSQEPGLSDYADNIDTMEFLLNL